MNAPRAPGAGNDAAFSLLLDTPTFGGHEMALAEWLADLPREAAPDVAALRCPAALLARLEAAGLACTPLHGSALAAWRWLRSSSPDRAARPVLLAPGAVQAGLALRGLVASAGRPSCIYVPLAAPSAAFGWRLPRARDAAARIVARGATRWIAPSDALCHALRERFGVQAPCVVLPPALPCAAFADSTPPGTSARGAPGMGPLRLLVIGRLDVRQKGLDWLATWFAARVRAGRTPRLHLTVQGEGEGAAVVDALASALGPAHVQVRPWGDAAAAMRDCDLLLLPSRVEGLPRVALEATALGRPVVATLGCGLGALLPPAQQVPFGEDAALDRALAALVAPAARAAAVSAARAALPRVADPLRRRAALHALGALAPAVGARR
jgi:glycosyltransferase involved in cell wall biosynthesis